MTGGLGAGAYCRGTALLGWLIDRVCGGGACCRGPVLGWLIDRVCGRGLLQGACPWPWRGRPRRRSAARTIRTAPAPCPTCPQHLATTASSSASTSTTSPAAPSPLGSPVPERTTVHPFKLPSPPTLTFHLPAGEEESSRVAPLSVGTSSDVSLQIAETDLSILTASIRAPSGHEEPCLLKRLPNRHIGAWQRCPLQARWSRRQSDTDLLLSPLPPRQASPSRPRKWVSTW